MIKDIKAFGFKQWLISLFFYNNLAVWIKYYTTCKLNGHIGDGYNYCINCWRILPICDECGIIHEDE